MMRPARLAQFGRSAALALALCAPAQAYYHYVHYVTGGRTGPFVLQQEKFGLPAGGTVNFFVSDHGPVFYAPGDSFGSLLGQVKQALAAWDSVSAPNLRVAFGGLETDGQSANAPGGDVVFQDLPPGLYGMGGPSSLGTTIMRGTVILSDNTGAGAGPSYLENFFTTAVHEVGHALGLQHTWTGSAMSQDVLRNTSRARPLDADDVAAINTLYGPAGWQNNFGTISGTVRFADGSPVSLASVVAISPTGAAISGLSNPDGTYKIEGIPAGNYLLYVHPLPPDAVPADGTGLRPPQDQNGGQFLPSGAFGTIFSPNTTDPRQATSFSVTQGGVIARQNFTVQAKGSVPAYDLITASYLDPSSRTPLYDLTNRQWWKVFPAFANSTQSGMFIEVRANSGDTPVPQSVAILGAGTASGDYLRIFNDPAGRALWLYFAPIFAATGPRHFVLNYGNDIFVMPQALNLVTRPAPAVASVATNSNGSVTVTGTSFGADSLVYFDGIQSVKSGFSSNGSQSSLTVQPPPGTNGQLAQVIVYNADGQNSTFAALNGLPTYTYSYPGQGAPQLQTVSLNSLPAGATGAVDITAQSTAFADGQVTVGFGSSDITVKRVWVLGPNHLLANVSVSPDAVAASSAVSVISGFAVLSQANAFQVLPKNPSLPLIGAVANANAAQQTLYPGGFAAVYGANLASAPSIVQVTLGGQSMTLQANGVFPGQVNFLIPAGFPTGPAILTLNNGFAGSNPIVVQVDAPPPAIQSVTNANGAAFDATHPASTLDMINVYVSGLDPAVLANPSRLQVTVNGQPMLLQGLAAAANGLTQISFNIAQGFAGGVVNLAVVVDGSASAPFALTVR